MIKELEPYKLGIYPLQDQLSGYFPTSEQKRAWTQDAPALEAAGPELQVIEDTTSGSERTLRLNLRSPRGADSIMAEVSAEDAILSAWLYGERYSRETARDKVFFKVIRVDQDGVEIALTLRAGVPVTIRLADVSQGLPLEGNQREAFNSGLRSGYGGGHGIDSMTLLHRKYQIP